MRVAMTRLIALHQRTGWRLSVCRMFDRALACDYNIRLYRCHLFTVIALTRVGRRYSLSEVYLCWIRDVQCTRPSFRVITDRLDAALIRGECVEII